MAPSPLRISVPNRRGWGTPVGEGPANPVRKEGTPRETGAVAISSIEYSSIRIRKG